MGVNAFLKRQLSQEHGSTLVIKSCHETEPFWSLRKFGSFENESKMDVNGPAQTRSRPLSFHFEAMDQFKVFLDKWEFVQSFNHINEFALLGGDGLIAILTNRECSDAMSDIAFER